MDNGKRAAAEAAADLIESGMIVGLGSGTTSAFFIDALGKRGVEIVAVATSLASEELARSRGIEVVDPDGVAKIDLVVDGADEVDSLKRLIKGGGGALLREKIVASIAEEMVVIVDQSKLVDHLGRFGLPLEVVPFGHQHTIDQLRNLGYDPSLRESCSDSGHCIVDLTFQQLIENPEREDQRIRSLPGIVETGLFLNLAGRVIVGYEDGRAEVTS